MNDVAKKLAEFSGKKLAVICIGSPLRGDDGFGPAVAARLAGESVFDAGPVPENILPKAARLAPEVVVFVDAADFGAEPGTLRLVSTEDLAASDVSTHSAPLSLAAEFLRQECGAACVLLAAQARQTAVGSAMSLEMARAVEEAATLLQTILARPPQARSAAGRTHHDGGGGAPTGRNATT